MKETKLIMQHGAIRNASSAHPVVKVPRRLEESTKLGFVCDSLWTASIGTELLVPVPVLPPLVFDITFACLVVLQNKTFLSVCY